MTVTRFREINNYAEKHGKLLPGAFIPEEVLP